MMWYVSSVGEVAGVAGGCNAMSSQSMDDPTPRLHICWSEMVLFNVFRASLILPLLQDSSSCTLQAAMQRTRRRP